MFQFAHSELLFLLFLLPLVVALFLLSNSRKRKLLHDFGDREIIDQLMPEYSSTRLVVKLIILMLALAFFILALAGPQFGTKLQETKRKGVEIVIALDVSNSMLAGDIQPNRLERAKQAIARMVDQLRNDKIGLIVFAGEAYVQLPITTDYVSAKMFLSTISPKIVPVQGTAVGAAINLAMKSFSPDIKSGKAIIVITDGENHEDDVVSAASEANKQGIKVNVVGIGSPEGAPISLGPEAGQQNFLKDENGTVIISKLDEALLQKVAGAGDGVYIRATNAEAGLNKILDEINKMNKEEYKAKVYSDYEDQYQWPMGLALLLLLAELIIFERKTRWSGKLNLFEVKN